MTTSQFFCPDRTPIPNREKNMSGTSDKIKGLANEAIGNVKQGVGKVTGNEKLQVEGAIQEKKGEAQQVVGKVKDAVDKK